METLRSVFVSFPTPKTHTNHHSNADGPIIGIEIMTKKEVDAGQTFVTTIYWAEDGKGNEGGGPTSYMSLADLCREFQFSLDEVTDIIARAFVERAGTDL